MVQHILCLIHGQWCLVYFVCCMMVLQIDIWYCESTLTLIVLDTTKKGRLVRKKFPLSPHFDFLLLHFVFLLLLLPSLSPLSPFPLSRSSLYISSFSISPFLSF